MTTPDPYAWLAWLEHRDAQVLLLSLMRAIEEGCDLPTLQATVGGWRQNALMALETENWQMLIDEFLEVCVDARLATPFLRRPHTEP